MSGMENFLYTDKLKLQATFPVFQNKQGYKLSIRIVFFTEYGFIYSITYVQAWERQVQKPIW